MLSQGANPWKLDWLAVAVEIRLEPDYIPSDDRDRGANPLLRSRSRSPLERWPVPS
jgi:hypothetical protein